MNYRVCTWIILGMILGIITAALIMFFNGY